MIALATALSASAALGCGGDAEQLSASELISRGDEICAEAERRFDEIQSEPPANPSEASGQTDELVDVAGDSLSELRGLRPPDELRDAYDAYLEARGSALELLEQGRDAASDQDAEGYATAQAEATAGEADRRKLAKAVGFKRCSAGD